MLLPLRSTNTGLVTASGIMPGSIASRIGGGVGNVLKSAGIFAPASTMKYVSWLMFKTIVMNISQDTYFIVEAGAKIPADFNTLPTPPPILDAIEPGIIPEAVTNPVFVDRNGNSIFDPPGLPVQTVSNDTAELPQF